MFDKKEYQRQYRKNNKEKLNAQKLIRTRIKRSESKIKAVKYMGSKCNHCGLETTHYSVYDFHHKNSQEKEYDPGTLMHYSWDKLKAELDKCIMLCANCHRILHEREGYGNQPI